MVPADSKRPTYVPLLADKRAEFHALASLSDKVRSSTRPLIQFRHLQRPQQGSARWSATKILLDHLQDPQHGLIGCWGTARPVLIDFGHLQLMEFEDPPLNTLFDWCHDLGLDAVPVTGRDRPEPMRDAIVRATRILGHGACIRVARDDLGVGSDGLRVLMRELDIPKEAIDLVLDVGTLPVDSAFLLSEVVTKCLRQFGPIPDWRSVALVGSSFPSSLSAIVEHNSYALLPRIEGDLWRRVRTASNGAPITYGDYGVISATPQPGFRGAANLRYTLPDQWLVERGSPLDRAAPDDYLTLAGHLRQQEAIWRGPTHCAGCAFIESQVRNGGVGNATQWREADFAHHFAVVSESLSLSPLDS